ncbi:hypothetical protein [Actinomadura sp. 9N407]|uniref:hypothetical protein n=1 Tax=Actinomadura sp. 9N407 TaxID=3375154 RepID=UPI0037A9BDC9
MGLPRPPEPFQRVYSPPEPPSPARRPRLLVILIAVVSFALAAGAVFVLVPDGDDRIVPASMPPGDSKGEGAQASSSASPSGTAPPSARPAPVEPITTLPPPCGTVAAGTVQSLIPQPERRESSNQTLTTCTYSSGGDDFRWLRVEAHLYAPAHTATPVDDAKSYFGAQWTQAHNATLERTVSLHRQSGMGDEAYRWFKADRGQPTVVGQVTVRVRNAVITVSYSEQTGDESAADARERDCLANATRVAREVLGGFR